MLCVYNCVGAGVCVRVRRIMLQNVQNKEF